MRLSKSTSLRDKFVATEVTIRVDLPLCDHACVGLFKLAAMVSAVVTIVALYFPVTYLQA